MGASAAEALLRRERTIIVGGLVMITVLSWIYLFTGAGMNMNILDMSRIAFSPGLVGGQDMASAMAMPQAPAGWTPTYWVLMVMMWWVMMIAMMVPSAAPTVLLYWRVSDHALKNQRLGPGAVSTAAFVVGYLAAWLGFSMLATALQAMLVRAGLVSAMMMWSLDPWLSALLLLAAGLYQFAPLKKVCLRHCRSPAQYLTEHWRSGRWGALLTGAHHGTFCVACCWALMALLFVGGIMNLLWIAGLALLVLVEKVAPRGERVAHLAGVACIAAAFVIGGHAAGVA